MIKHFCDCCGKEIEHDDIAIMTYAVAPAFGESDRHFHIQCAVRVLNNMNSFCAKVRKEENKEC